MIPVQKINDVIKLANERKELYDNDPNLDHILLDAKLLNYLNQLSLDEFKSLHTIMYLGRGEEDYGSNLIPLEKYHSMLNELEHQGWETRDIETRQILGKMPLGRYLEEGKKMAGF